jgi:hypothetical protein
MSAKSKFTVAANSNAVAAKSTAVILSESIAPGMDGDGNLWIVFRGSEGKGTGQQEVPVEQLSDLLTVVGNMVENGAPDEEELSAADMFTRTFALRDAPEGKTGQYCTFRLNSGKGAKPVTIPLADLGTFFNTLKLSLPTALRSAKAIKGISEGVVSAANQLAYDIENLG